MRAMDHPDIIECIVGQLNLASQVDCTLVNRAWYRAARRHLDKRYIYNLDRQKDTLRYLALTKLSAPTCYSCLHELSQLKALHIYSDVRFSTSGQSQSASDPDPTSSPPEYDLTYLLGRLTQIRALYLSSLDLRPRPLSQSRSKAEVVGTDAALIALADSRLRQHEPGLAVLDIKSSLDLSDKGFIHYLTATQPSSRPHSADICQNGIDFAQLACGYPLTTLTLVSCPNLTSESLRAIGKSCPRLRECIFRNVDDLFLVGTPSSTTSSDANANHTSVPAGVPTSDEQLSYPICEFVLNCHELHTLHLSINVKDVPSDYFDAFVDHPSLRTLSLTSSKYFTARHLSSFTTVQKLSISGCPSINKQSIFSRRHHYDLQHESGQIDFTQFPRLRELSFLGNGLTVQQLWDVWRHCPNFRKINLDSVDYWWYPETSPISSEASQTARGRKRAIRQDEDDELPILLKPFKNYNILSCTRESSTASSSAYQGTSIYNTVLPAWVLCYLLSLSPPSLESFDLHGTVIDDDQSSNASDDADDVDYDSRFGGHGIGAHPFGVYHHANLHFCATRLRFTPANAPISALVVAGLLDLLDWALFALGYFMVTQLHLPELKNTGRKKFYKYIGNKLPACGGENETGAESGQSPTGHPTIPLTYSELASLVALKAEYEGKLLRTARRRNTMQRSPSTDSAVTSLPPSPLSALSPLPPSSDSRIINLRPRPGALRGSGPLTHMEYSFISSLSSPASSPTVSTLPILSSTEMTGLSLRLPNQLIELLELSSVPSIPARPTKKRRTSSSSRRRSAYIGDVTSFSNSSRTSTSRLSSAQREWLDRATGGRIVRIDV